MPRWAFSLFQRCHVQRNKLSASRYQRYRRRASERRGGRGEKAGQSSTQISSRIGTGGHGMGAELDGKLANTMLGCQHSIVRVFSDQSGVYETEQNNACQLNDMGYGRVAKLCVNGLDHTLGASMKSL